MESRLISIIVPVFNEADTLEPLAEEIRDVARQNDLRTEIVFVDDGSGDASWSKISALSAADPSIAGVRFRRRFGKAAALMAGFRVARSELVVTMDADLQDPPSEIPKLIQAIDDGFDVVSGWKRNRHDPWHKVYPSRVFNAMTSSLTGVSLHDHVCGLKCYRREVVRTIRIHGEMHRFLGVLAAARGYRVTEVPTSHRPRTHGASKYGPTRFVKGFLDLLTVLVLTRYRWRPQHLIGAAGLAFIVLALVLWSTMLPSFAFDGWPADRLIKVITILTVVAFPGILLISIGLVAELVVARGPIDGLYDVAERVGWCGENQGQPG